MFGSFSYKLLSELTKEQRQRVKPWAKNALGVTHFSDHVFGKKHRITIPVENHESEAKPSDELKHHLESHGIHVTDYKAGTAKDKHGRTVKIGKALESTKAPAHLKHQFVTDPKRTGSNHGNQLAITISRHPHDVAGMSTDRGWSSCLNMNHNPHSGHVDKSHQLKHEVERGTHVAYLHYKHDKDLKHPIARIKLNPYHSEDGSHTVLHPEEHQLGHSGDAFKHTVSKWTKKHFPLHKGKIYSLDSKVSTDSDPNDLVDSSKESLDKLVSHKDPGVRKFVAHHAHKEHLEKLINDPNHGVAALAKRKLEAHKAKEKVVSAFDKLKVFTEIAAPHNGGTKATRDATHETNQNEHTIPEKKDSVSLNFEDHPLIKPHMKEVARNEKLMEFNRNRATKHMDLARKHRSLFRQHKDSEKGVMHTHLMDTHNEMAKLHHMNFDHHHKMIKIHKGHIAQAKKIVKKL